MDMASDLEDGEGAGGGEADYLPSAAAWGRSRSAFYNTDQTLDDHTGLGQEDLEDAELEEAEARRLQVILTTSYDNTAFFFASPSCRRRRQRA